MAIPTFITDGEGGQVRLIDGAIPVTSTGTGNAVQVVPDFNSGAYDAFGRSRVSTATALFNSKSVDSAPYGWDDQEVSGTGTSSTYLVNESSVRIGVAASTAGRRTRQTIRYLNYYPSRSHLMFMTFAAMDTVAGLTKQAGLFDDDDGVFFRSRDGASYFVLRSSTSGSPVDTEIPQFTWNIDRLDGNGKSGYNLDPSKGNILVVDYEWLGVGQVRYGFVIDGQIIYCHAVGNANNVNKVYMKSPNLPVRYEIINDGTGPLDTMDCICVNVSTEGGRDLLGTPRAAGHQTQQTLSGITNSYAMLAMRLKTTHKHSDIRLTNFQSYASTNDGILMEVMTNPTINGTMNFQSVPDSSVEVALGDGSNFDITVTGNIVYKQVIHGQAGGTPVQVTDAPLLGTRIDGTPTVLVLAQTALTNGPKALAIVNWNEL